jgi:hypothetical protein
MSRYIVENARLSIISKLAKFDNDHEVQLSKPYKLEVRDQSNLSPEAKESLALLAEKQAWAVNYYFPTKSCTKE